MVGGAAGGAGGLVTAAGAAVVVVFAAGVPGELPHAARAVWALATTAGATRVMPMTEDAGGLGRGKVVDESLAFGRAQ